MRSLVVTKPSNKLKTRIDMKPLDIIRNGIITENPTFVLLLGMCPTLATTSSASNGLAMGLATMFVLICANTAISLIKNLVPDMVHPMLHCGYCRLCDCSANGDAGLYD